MQHDLARVDSPSLESGALIPSSSRACRPGLAARPRAGRFAFPWLDNGNTGRKVHFRWTTPTRVLSEAFGTLIAYSCIRLPMAETTRDEGKLQPRFLSFVGCLDEIRSGLGYTGVLDPEQLRAARTRVLVRLRASRLPPRRQRSYPRIVEAALNPHPANKNRSKAA